MPYSRYSFILFFPIFFIMTDMSHAGPLLYRIQQQKAMKQRQNQGMTQEQYQQYQEYQEQQQGDHAPQAPAPPTYQQTVDQRNQAIAQAILNAHNQSVSSESEPLGNNAGAGQAQQQTAYPGVPQQQTAPQALPSEAQDTVDLSEVWKKLDNKSTVWSLLIDDQAKLLTVSEYIDRFHKEGVKINEPPLHYAQRDGLSALLRARGRATSLEWLRELHPSGAIGGQAAEPALEGAR